MPLIIDKDLEKQKILSAFEECLVEKPLFNISLRDIASKANMTHPKLLNYYNSKDSIVIAYCDYIKNYMSLHCKKWFKEHSPKSYSSRIDYMNAFMEYVANGVPDEKRPIATVQTYVLAKYNSDVNKMIKDEFSSWKNLMKNCLTSVYGNSITDNEAEYMMILIAGVFVCNYNDVLSGNINKDILSQSFFLK